MVGKSIEIHHLDRINAPTITDWRSLLRLAKRNSSTLGFLPDSAFADRVRNGTLVVARLAGDVVGYCLYDLPRAGHIKLVHVCVDESGRGHSAGKKMIAAAIEKNPHAIGVLAYCRDDYAGMDRFWASAGLAPRGERAGRAQAGSTLIRWWRPLGGLDLIEEATLSTGHPLVVYDTNVVSDLYASDSVNRPGREASRGLLAGWLQAAITPAVSPRVDIEINRIEDKSERRLQRERSDGLLRLRSVIEDEGTIVDELIERVGHDVVDADRSLADDLHHVADAIMADAAYFVTNDDNLLRSTSAALANFTKLRIVRPHELVTEMLFQLEQPVFQSRLIESVDLEWTPAADHPVDELVEAFVTHESQERASDLRRSIRTALAMHPRTTRVLVSPEGRRWALLAEHQDGPELQVDILRTARGPANGTIALQLARHVRVVARDSGLLHTRVSDQYLSGTVKEALLADGYEQGPFFTATLIDAAVNRSDFAVSNPGARLEQPREIRAVERKFWPLVLVQTNVPAFIVPIQPRFAERLFGLERGALWGDRKRGLGLSREHVYYSGSGRAIPTTGARILWYVTSDQTGTYREVTAFSRCLGGSRTTPQLAHEANAQVGVFGQRDVVGAADKAGLVTVVRFEDTELLDEPLGGNELARLFEQYGVKHPIPSFREVDPHLFDAIAIRQRGRTL